MWNWVNLVTKIKHETLMVKIELGEMMMNAGKLTLKDSLGRQ